MTLLTGGGDRPYALGLATSLAASGVTLDFIGSDSHEAPALQGTASIRFLNIRGDMSAAAPVLQKTWRVATYYCRLLRYAAATNARIFHILWNNRIELLDRTVLMAYYRMLGRRVVMTVHNVNIRKRDGRDSLLNRLTLRAQYRLADHLFVHTSLMKAELMADFGVPEKKASVIPFGINDSVPDTGVTRLDARRRLGLSRSDKVVLFFGNIAPYKGLEFLVDAFDQVRSTRPDVRLLIAGRPKGHIDYWRSIEQTIAQRSLGSFVTARAEFVPDEETELYFKAADVLVLPYLEVFQSGVLFLGYNFGLPVIASDVGSLKDDIVEGVTGWTCAPRDAGALAHALDRFFNSPLFTSPTSSRSRIRDLMRTRNSWATVATMTKAVYQRLGG